MAGADAVRRVGAVIFAVAGTQLPFPRLMTAMDNVAARLGLDVVAQTSDPHFVPRAMTARPFILPDEFDAHVARCTLMVAHAGIGVIIAAAEHRKPLIVMPREAKLGEHRNEHQLATVRRCGGMPGLQVVRTEAELERAVRSAPSEGLGRAAPDRRQVLVDALRQSVSRQASPAGRRQRRRQAGW